MKLKKGDIVLLKRETKFETEKELIEREIRFIEEDKIICDDNIEYNFEQVVDVLFNNSKING